MSKNTKTKLQKGRQAAAPAVSIKEISEIEIPKNYDLTFDETRFFFKTFKESNSLVEEMYALYRLAFIRGQQAAGGQETAEEREARRRRDAVRQHEASKDRLPDCIGGFIKIDCPKEYRLTTDDCNRIYYAGGGIYWMFEKVFNLAFDRGHTVGFERGYRAANL